METGRSETDLSDSIAVSALISVLATGLIYVELWGGSLPDPPAAPTLALTVVAGLLAGACFFYTGTHSTPLEDLPVFGVLLVLTAVAFFLFPEGLPVAVEIGIVVAVWTDTALRTTAALA